ncbi:MAG: RNA-binding protein, partial [Geminicoccaceae bacterium]
MTDSLVEHPLVEPEAGGSARSRRCIGTRGARPKDALIRFVVGPDSTLVPDLGGRLPGRGLWVSADRDVLGKALARNQFAKAARAPVKAPEGLADHVAELLVQRCLDRIGLARRAGELVVGFDQVADWLRGGRCRLVLCARDGAAEGRRRIEALAGEVPVIVAFDRAELGRAVGREEVVHAGLARGGIARELSAD